MGGLGERVRRARPSLLQAVRGSAAAAKFRFKRTLARRGWHIGRLEIDWSREVYLPRLFEAFEINCVLDVGARVGDFGVLLRQAGYTGQIVSFEPIAAHYAVLQQRCANDDRWTAYPYALGSSESSAVINVMYESSYSSMHQPSEYGDERLNPGNAVERTETIQIRRLDDVFSGVTRGIAQPRVYLKMDTQGWDLEVFRGAQRSLEHIPALQTELSVIPLYEDVPRFDEALATYRAAGYRESAFFREVLDPHWRLAEFDCVMVRDPDLAS